jgi:hypothetical protein
MANELKARIVKKKSRNWTNKHENFTQRIAGLYDVWNPSGSANRQIEAYNATTKALRELIGKTTKKRERIRALGSAWSISNAAATDGRLINTKPLNRLFRISGPSISKDYTGDPDNLFFVQCGVSIGELNRFLRQQGKSLKTSGASNGQTIAGALSTGTHGSAIDTGAIQDFVKGLHLITGPNRHVWLERASEPVTSPQLAERLGAEVIRDDDTFNAALVSFGSYGIIHGVLIETEDLYLLEASRIKLSFDDHLKHVIHTLDFDRISLPEPDQRPYHFEIVINPHATDRQAFCTVMYKKPFIHKADERRKSSGGFQPGDDFLCVIGTLLDIAPVAIPGAVNKLIASQYREYSGRTGALGDIFSATGIRGKATGAAMGVPLDEAGRALNAVLNVHNRSRNFPGVIALRYVKKSDALLAFTRYSPTCVIDLDAVDNQTTKNFFRGVWREFDQLNIPYTMHWGKANELTSESVRTMYGEDLETWLKIRRSLLKEEDRLTFSSPFTDQCGLSE